MHSGNPETSTRLKRTLDYLRSAGPHGCTTAELQGWTRSMAPGTDCSELRQSGYLIECDYVGKWNGRKVYRYRYLGRKYDAEKAG